MDSKEQLIYFFLQGKISLSQYDYKFMVNLQTMIHNSHRVTSNQADLFDKLISKYAKQLTRAGLVKEELKVLPWKAMLVESTPEYTGANITLDEDILTVRVPFNKTFIANFRLIEDNPFEWIKEEKVYKAKFSTIALKTLYKFLPMHFAVINYCEELRDVVQELSQYEHMVWQPTLVKVNDRIVLYAANTVAAGLIENIELNSDIDTLFQLSKYQLPAHPSVYDYDPKLKFVYEFITEVDIDDLADAVQWIKMMDADCSVVSSSLNRIKGEVESIFNQAGVNLFTKYRSFSTNVGSPASVQSMRSKNNFLLQPHSNLNTIAMDHYAEYDKIILIKNSRPVEVK